MCQPPPGPPELLVEFPTVSLTSLYVPCAANMPVDLTPMATPYVGTFLPDIEESVIDPRETPSTNFSTLPDLSIIV